MYYGSRYCLECKFNRDCFSKAGGWDPQHQNADCIIMEKIFEKEYRKENINGNI